MIEATRRHLVDLSVVVVGIASLADNLRRGGLFVLLVLTTAAWVGATLLRHRWPLAPLAVAAMLAFRSILSPSTVPSRVDFLVLLLAAWLLGYHAPRWQRVVAGGVAFPVFVAVMRYRNQTGHPTIDVAYISLFVASSLLVGFVAGRHEQDERAQRSRLAEERQRSEDLRGHLVAEERASIARELHDVVSQGVSAMTVQAGAARMSLETGDRGGAARALEQVEDAARTALSDLRRMFDVLRIDTAPEAPEPSGWLSRLPMLARSAELRGLDVDLNIGSLPGEHTPGMDAVAYQLIQDSLGDAAAAGAARAVVSIDCDSAILTIEIRQHRRAHPTPSGAKQSLRRRVEALGGTLIVDDCGNDQLIRTILPVEGHLS